MSNRLYNAILFAMRAHEGVIDKSGKPYILHPFRVMLRMETEDEQIIAILHDVVEDTTRTLADIEYAFGKDIRDGVDALTRRDEETYFEYIGRVKQHPIGRKVKIADVLDNMAPARMAQLPPQSQGIIKRYEKALKILEAL